ncbi:MAG: hypothetical protein KC731_25255, partial [Myxococcales bacterium]|nr:hypothetical protein [Myxococcales bacterium]
PIDPHPTAPLLAHLTESGEVALLDTTTRIVSTRFTGPRFERRADTRDDSLAMRFSPTGAHLVVQRALDPIAVCDVAKKQCHPLAMVATENAPAPQWRGDVVFLQGAGVLAWSPDPSNRWHVEAKPDHLGFDVTPDGRHAAFALGSEVRLVRLRDRRAVRLTARPGPKNVVGEMEPAGLDLLAP